MDNPVLLRIERVHGSDIVGARLQQYAPIIPGFLAVESQSFKDATQYIALSEIKSITLLNDECCNIYNFFPSNERYTR